MGFVTGTLNAYYWNSRFVFKDKNGDVYKRQRQNPVKAFGSFDVLKMRDYKSDEVLDMSNGQVSTTGLPTSNVLYYELGSDAWCCARPSGTEPKIKFYMGVKGESLKDADEKLKELTEALMLQIGE